MKFIGIDNKLINLQHIATISIHRDNYGAYYIRFKFINDKIDDIMKFFETSEEAHSALKKLNILHEVLQ